MPKLSILISASDNGQCFTTCLDSILAQTMKDIEIICINNSNDMSVSQSIREYASSDSRLLIVNNDDHLSPSQIRKTGVLTTTGDYVIFLDDKSELIITACEVVSNALETYHPDILQFSIQEIDYLDTSSVLDNANQEQSCAEPLIFQNVNLLNSCWRDHICDCSLQNKVIRGDLCRQAFALHEDGQFLYGDDLYSFFLIAYFSHSYINIKNVLCFHHIDSKITGNAIRSLEDFDNLLEERHIYDYLKDFIQQHEAPYEDLDEILDLIRYQFLYECVDQWWHTFNIEYLSESLKHLIHSWGLKDTLCMLAEQGKYKEYSIAEKILQTDCLRYQPKQVPPTLTIAAYYHSISGGGAQRVIAELCNLWSKMHDKQGNYLYNVILITDTGPDKEDYPLEARVRREYLPDYKSAIGMGYAPRFDAWNDILSRTSINFIISSAWSSAYTLWDMLCVRGISPHTAFALHAQSFNCTAFIWGSITGLRTTRMFELSDGVITLSDCDYKFANCFSNNVKYIDNPLTFDIHTTPLSSYRKNTLLWIGRIAKEKQPLDLIYMMYEVVQEIPDVKLYIVGDSNSDIYNKMQSVIDELNLQDNITLTGFTLNVDEYYSQASLLISTSEYEGSPLVFSEAMSFAIPIITYDMPWLTFIKDGRGIITVPQKRYDLMAKEVIALLKNPQRISFLGKQGKQQISKLSENNIEQDWYNFIYKTVYGIKDTYPIDIDIKILFENLVNIQHKGQEQATKYLSDQISQVNEINKDLLITIQNEKNSKAELNQQLVDKKNEQTKTLLELTQANEKKEELSGALRDERKEKTALINQLQNERDVQERLKYKLSKAQNEKAKLIINMRSIDNELIEAKDQLNHSLKEQAAINHKLDITYKKVSDCNKQIDENQHIIEGLRKEIDAIHNSATYKIGRTITWPIRKLRDLRK